MENITINQDRLAQAFVDLVHIDSVSKEEGAICKALQVRLESLGATTCVDNAGPKVGSDTGNLLAFFPGVAKATPLLLSAHMDTVEPGRGVQPVLKNGIFTSAGDTILGADDKCGIAIILEALTCVQESNLFNGPLEVVFSIGEELGLQGVKHLDFGKLSAKMGYVLDTRHTGVLITRAPAANHIRFEVQGRAAHAGAEPEKGISAIVLAARAIAQLNLGRIDQETTCNIGTIYGGMATNIVPEKVVVEAEVRSHDSDRLNEVTDAMVRCFNGVVNAGKTTDGDGRPKLKVAIERAFDRVAIDEDQAVVVLAKAAAAEVGQTIACATSGGASDASVYTRHGIVSGVLGTGCDKVHTVDEQVALGDMVQAAQLLTAIIQLHAKNERKI